MAPSEETHEHAAPLDGLRVLLVEDDPDGRELFTLLLANQGAEVLSAGSADEALAALDAARFDVLVSDIGLPGRDGFELIAAIRARGPERDGTIPAVAVTAYNAPGDREHILAAGFQAHIAKPVEMSFLVAVIASLADRVDA
jgi:CheY-like chemotaxis protein